MVNKRTLCSVRIDLRSYKQGHILLGNSESVFNMHFDDTWHLHATEIRVMLLHVYIKNQGSCIHTQY